MRLKTIREFRSATEHYAPDVDASDDWEASNDIPSNINFDKITPDTFYKQLGSTVFIFTADGKLLFDDDEFKSHNHLIFSNRKLFGIDFDFNNPNADFKALKERILDYRKNIILKHHLLGRCGFVGNEQVVAFWNDAALPNLINPCLDALESEGIIISDTIVLLANGKTFQASARGTATKELSGTAVDSKKARERELMQQLHLMQPQQKKAAMKELGLVGGGHKQPWQKAAERTKVINPGQKWWAMQSEEHNDERRSSRPIN